MHIIILYQMPRMYLHCSKEKKRPLNLEKNPLSHGSREDRSLILMRDSKFFSKMKKILLPLYSNTSTQKMLVCTHVLPTPLEERLLAALNSLLKEPCHKC